MPLYAGLRSIINALQTPVLAVLGAVLIGAVIMVITGHDPLAAYWAMLAGAVGGQNLSATISRAAPIVGMGLTAAVAFRAGFFNLGGEGQLILGGLTSALVAIYLPLPGPLSPVKVIHDCSDCIAFGNDAAREMPAWAINRATGRHRKHPFNTLRFTRRSSEDGRR